MRQTQIKILSLLHGGGTVAFLCMTSKQIVHHGIYHSWQWIFFIVGARKKQLKNSDRTSRITRSHQYVLQKSSYSVSWLQSSFKRININVLVCMSEHISFYSLQVSLYFFVTGNILSSNVIVREIILECVNNNNNSNDEFEEEKWWKWKWKLFGKSHHHRIQSYILEFFYVSGNLSAFVCQKFI